MEAQMSDLSTPSFIVLLGILALFAWHGLRRGVQLEAALTLSIASMRFLINRWGDTIVKYTNNVYYGVQFIIQGGLGSDEPARVFDTVRQTPLLISETGREAYLLLLFIGVIVLTYWLSQRVWKTARSWAGALLGVLNGYLLLTFLLPFLGGRPPAPSVLAHATAERAAQLVERSPVAQLTGQSGTALLLLVIVAVILLAARSLQDRGG
jgi:hypothetical protein